MFINIETRGNHLLVREYGKDFVDSSFQPELYFISQHKSEVKTMVGGHSAVPIVYDNIKEFNDAIRQAENYGEDIFGSRNAINQYANSRYNGDQELDMSEYKIFNIDIEVDVTTGEFPTPLKSAEKINAITVIFAGSIYVWGLAYEGASFKPADDVIYMEFTTERDLLTSFVKFWAFHKPHIITGWNIEGFDIPYIWNRCCKVIGKDLTSSISPWDWVTTKKGYDKFGNERDVVVIKGVSVLDYLLLYQKFEFAPRENYKLDTIAHAELGESKIDYSEYGSLMKLYREDYQKFMEYNIKDTLLVERLEEKKKLIELAITIAAYGKINLDKVFMTIPIWESIVYNRLIDRNIVPKIRTQQQAKAEPYDGAFVKDVVAGLYKWLGSFDLASLYPSVLRQWNIGPETLVDPREVPEELAYLLAETHVETLLDKKYDLSALKDHGMTMTANGYFFRTETKSHFSKLMEDLFNERKKEKGLMKKYKNELLKVREEIAKRKNKS